METTLRKYQNTLIITSTGVLFFGIWSMLKTILTLVLSTPDSLLSYTDGYTGIPGFILLVVSALGFLVVDLLFRFFIWRSASAEGSGQRKNSAYLILSGLLMILELISLFSTILSLPGSKETLLTSIVSLAVEITSIVTLAQLIYSAFVVRKLTRKITQA